jgi:hypothetical protein
MTFTVKVKHCDFQSALFDTAPEDLLESFKVECLKRLNKVLMSYGKKFGFDEISIKLKVEWEIHCFDEKGDRIKEFGFSDDDNKRGPDKELASWLDANSFVLHAYKHKNPDVDSFWVKAEKEDYFSLFSSIVPLQQDENSIPDELQSLLPYTNSIRKKVAKFEKTYVVIAGDYKGLVGKLIRETSDQLKLRVYGKNGKLLAHEINLLKIQVKANEKNQTRDLSSHESWMKLQENLQEKR